MKTVHFILRVPSGRGSLVYCHERRENELVEILSAYQRKIRRSLKKISFQYVGWTHLVHRRAE
jgi:hypothetical protein